MSAEPFLSREKTDSSSKQPSIDRAQYPLKAQVCGFFLRFIKATTQLDGGRQQQDVVGSCYCSGTSGRQRNNRVLVGPIIIASLFAAGSFAFCYWAPDAFLNGTNDETGVYPEDYLTLVQLPLAFAAKDLTFQVYRFFNGLRGVFCNKNLPGVEYRKKRNSSEKSLIFLLGMFRILLHEIPSIVVYGLLLLPGNPLLLNIMSFLTQIAIYTTTAVVLNFLAAVRTARLFRYSQLAVEPPTFLVDIPAGNTDSVENYQQNALAHSTAIADQQKPKSVRALNFWGCLPLIAASLIKVYVLDPKQMEAATTGESDLENSWCLLSCFLLSANISMIPEFSLLIGAIWNCCSQRRTTQPNREGVLYLLGQLVDKFNMALVPVAVCAVLYTLNMLSEPNGGIAFVKSADYMPFSTGISVLCGVAPYLTYGINTGYQRKASENRERSRSSNSSHRFVPKASNAI